MKQALMGVILLLLPLRSAADFVDESRAAHALFHQGKWPEAAAAFETLTERAPAAHRDLCRVYHARALARTKNYDEALAVADTVADTRRKAYARMCVMYAASRWKDLLADYADEPVEAWPDDIDHLGHHMRGVAYYRAQHPAEALPDLEQAAARAGTDGWPKWEALYYTMCGAEKAGDLARATAAADRLLADESTGRGGWPYLLCAFWKIQRLIAESDLDAAERLLADLNAGRTWGQDEYLLRYHEAAGDLALARGDNAAARESYAKATAITTHASHVERVRNKLEKLGAAP